MHACYNKCKMKTCMLTAESNLMYDHLNKCSAFANSKTAGSEVLTPTSYVKRDCKTHFSILLKRE